jgi:hypothetical protein
MYLDSAKGDRLLMLMRRGRLSPSKESSSEKADTLFAAADTLGSGLKLAACIVTSCPEFTLTLK